MVTENSPLAGGREGYAVNQNIAQTAVTDEARSLLDEIVHQGAQDMLTAALKWEIAEFLERHETVVDEQGNRLVVRNGYLPERTIQAGSGELKVRQGRVRDRRGAEDPDRVRFTSAILPPYLKKSKSIEELIPWLYLRGISTGDFQEALQALLGEGAKGLSATTINRLTKIWEQEYEGWSRRSLEGKEYVYIWADGVYFSIRLEEEDRQCILVLMGATAEGKKELIGILDGYRESTQSWRELLLDVKMRGLVMAPKLATAPCMRSTPRHGSNCAGSTRPPGFSTACPRGCRPRRRAICTRSGRPRRKRRPRRPLIDSRPSIKRSTRRRWRR
jgi:transposase-like protein